MTLRFYMHQPDTIFAARIDELVAVTYPIQDITFDTVTTGAFGDIKAGMTVLFGSAAGLDDYGRNRVRAAATSTVLKIGRSSIGTRDGEVQVVDGAYITVLNDYRIWSKVPYIDGDDNGAMYKDGDIEVGTNTTTPPPVANAGPPAAGTIDSGTSKLTVTLPPYTPNNSFATALGASISSYAWVIPSGVTLAGGSVLTDAEIQVDCDPGFYWIELTVTDSNAKTHTTRTFVYARDPDADDTIGATQITEHRVTRHGQTLSIRVTQDIAATSYLDGSICLLMDGEPESQAVRRNILFWGWGQTDPASILVSKEATLSETTIKCVDVGGRLDTLPGFTQALYNDVKREDANPAITWAYFENPNWDNLLHYILHWHSTSLELTDWVWTGVGASFPFTVREAGGSSLFDQMNTQCESLCPAHYFTCDRQGLLACPVDPMLQEVGDRTATVQANIPVSNWSKIKYTHQRPPRTHWLDDSAILANGIVVNGIFSHAPGDAPGQGEMRNTHGEQIAVSQTVLNQVTGHRYARMNAPESLFTITQTQDQDNLIDPAAMEWTTVTITAALAAERGLSFITERGLVSEMSIRYKADKEAVTRTVVLLWERETVGLPAVTVIPPAIPAAEDYDPYPDPDAVTSDFYGSPGYYIIFDKNHVARTSDVMASPPTWELIDSGISGDIYDVQYTTRPNSVETVGAWCLTSTGVYHTADVLAGSVIWAEKLTLATMRASEVAPDDGDSEFVNMIAHGARPGALMVFTSPNAGINLNGNWQHAYSHFTDDYGASWTVCDSADELTATNSGGTHGYFMTASRNSNWNRHLGGRLHVFRNGHKFGVGYNRIIMYSDDDGDTWQAGSPNQTESTSSLGAQEQGAILNPFPNATDPMWCAAGTVGVSTRPNLYKSVDNGVTWVEQSSLDTAYFGVAMGDRPNSMHHEDGTDVDNVVIWAYLKADSDWDLIESIDGGATWDLIWDPGVNSGSNGPYQAPNGWPADENVWFNIYASTLFNSGGTDELEPAITRVTDRYATTPTEIGGNLAALWTTANNWNPQLSGMHFWASGGMALPKIGLNA